MRNDSMDPRQTTKTPKLRVLVFAASLRADSFNRKLAALAARVAEHAGAIVDHASMRDFDLPLYDGDLEKAEGIPRGAEELKRRLLESDAFILSSPEYNGSMPGTIKNLIDWTSRFRPQPRPARTPDVGIAFARWRQPRSLGVADAARAPGRADLPGHVLAGDGAYGPREGRHCRRGFARALRQEPPNVPVARRSSEALPMHEAILG
jgi:hypothetical protein